MSLLYHPAYASVQVTSVKPKISTIGKLFLAVFFVVLFEGAVRKWISSALTNPLVLLRDCLALYGIYWALSQNKFKTRNIIFKVLMGWTAIVVFWGGIQLLINQSSPLIFFIGLRFWLLYLWFACAAAVAMTEHDFRIIIKIMLILTLCMTPLIIIQFFSPSGAFINRQVDGDEDKVFLLTADFVRTTGLFSFTAGQSTLLAVVTPFVLSALMGANQFFKRKWMPVAVFMALAICTMLSGSRSALAMFVILFVAMILLEIFFSKGKSRTKKSAIIVLSLVIFISVPFFFSSALDATTERVVNANESEDLSNRILSIFFGEPTIHDKIPLLGHGFGMGTNFVGFLLNTQFSMGETEAARILMEGGAVGFVFVALKMAVLIIAIKKAFFIARSTGNTLPILLWVSLLIAIFSWSIIGQLTVNALGYMFFGLGIASLRFVGAKK